MEIVKERNKTHLIYLDKEGHAWMQEHNIGSYHPENAEFYCEVPLNESKKWIDGKPTTDNKQFLTLSPFYPSGRLDVSIEINREPKIMKNVNHPAFEGCVKYMSLDVLDFRNIPRHIPRVIYTIGLCHYGHTEAFKTVEIEEDDKSRAIAKGRALLKPSTVESVKYVSCRSNKKYDEHYSKKPKLKM